MTHTVGSTVEYTVGYGYDGRGLRTRLLYPDGTEVTYRYDAAGRLIAVEEGASPYAVYAYDAAGRVLTATLGNGTVTSYRYDAAGRLLEVTHHNGDDLLARFEYAYDARGNRVRAVETVLAAGGGAAQGEGWGKPPVPGEPSRPSPGEPPALPEPFRIYLPSLPSSWPPAVVQEEGPADGALVARPAGLPQGLPPGPPGPPLVRERAAYRASFDENGLRFTPKTRLLEQGTYHLDFRLTQVRSGRTRLFHPGVPQRPPISPPGREDLVWYDRGEAFREEYRLTEGGLEQRFLFLVPIALDGDLMLEGAFSGNLHPILRESTGEVQFLTPKGEALASYGRAIVEDALGRRTVAPLTLSGRHLRIVIPEEWLAQAAYPVLVDPLIGPNVALSTQPLSGDQEQAAMASADGSAFLVAWQSEGNGDDIYAQAVSAEGALLSETVPIATLLGDQRHPDVAANPGDGEYLIVWQDGGFLLPDWDIYAQRVADDGSRLGGSIAVYTGTNDQQNPTVALNPDDETYLVIWQSDDPATGRYHLYGQVVQANGALNGTAVSLYSSTAALSDPEVAFNPVAGRYLLAWQEQSGRTDDWDLYGRIIGADGRPLGDAFAVAAAPQDQAVPAVAASRNAEEFLVVWQAYTATGGLNDIHAQRVGADGTLLGGRIEVAAGSDEQRAPQVATAGAVGQYLVAWEVSTMLGDWDLRAQRLSGAGDPVGRAILLYSGAGHQRAPAVAFDEQADAYLAAWQDYRSGSAWEVYGRPVDGDGTLDEEVVIGAEAAGGAQEEADVAYGSAQGLYLAVWQDGRNGNDDIYGQLVTGGGALVGDPIAIAHDAGQKERAPAVAYDPEHDEYLVVWEQEAILGLPGWSLYAQRVDEEGNLLGGAIALCTAGGDQQNAAVAYNALAGAFLVVWEDGRGGDGDIYGRSVVTESLGAEFALYDDVEAHGQGRPAIAAAGGSGEYLVVWEHEGGGAVAIYGRRTTVTGTVGAALAVAAGAGERRSPAVAATGRAGEYLVVWQHSAGSGAEVHGRRVSSEGALLGSEMVLASGAGDHLHLDLAWDARSGGYALVWQAGSANEDIHGVLLDEAGAVVGAEEVLSAAENAQERPALAYDTTRRRFLAVWADHRHATTAPDIYGQLYAGHSRVILYRYDPLGRLVGADYSGGEAFAYRYDAVGNRTVMTTVTPLSGTVVTTYQYDPAGRLTGRQVSAGRAYTYTWSLRKGGRYFDPVLGLYLTLGPPGVGGMVAGCGPIPSPTPWPIPSPICTELPSPMPPTPWPPSPTPTPWPPTPWPPLPTPTPWPPSPTPTPMPPAPTPTPGWETPLDKEEERVWAVKQTVLTLHGEFPPELVFAIAARETGERVMPHWDNEVANGDGIMQVTSGTPGTRRAPYKNTFGSIWENIEDGIKALHLRLQWLDDPDHPQGYDRKRFEGLGDYQFIVRATMHYNGGDMPIHTYLSGAGDKHYLQHVADELQTTVPHTFGPEYWNGPLYDALIRGDSIVQALIAEFSP